MTRICISCAKEPHLKELLVQKGKSGKCHICGETGIVLNSNRKDFFQLIKALIRYHYSEWEYNGHLGGDSIGSLFYRSDNIFFEEGRVVYQDKYEDLVQGFCDGPVYEDYNKGITLFAGYDSECMQNLALRSIKTDLDGKILRIAERLARENHFVLEQEIIEILRPYQKVAASFLDSSDTLYRARVGIKEAREYYPGGYEMGVHFKPYTQEEIGAPPPYLASSGRVNRAGVSFLYCATEKDTALAEVRPHPGDRVSIAVMRVNSQKRLFDLSQSKLIHYFKNDERLDGYRALNTLSVFLGRTIPPSERDQYSITQLIADCVRQLGFDGIMFSSTVGSGKNVVLFDGLCITQVEAGAEVALIKSVKYEYAQEDLVVEDTDYYY